MFNSWKSQERSIPRGRNVLLGVALGVVILALSALTPPPAAAAAAVATPCPTPLEADAPALQEGEGEFECERDVDWDWKFINLCFDVTFTCEWNGVTIIIEIDDAKCVF